MSDQHTQDPAPELQVTVVPVTAFQQNCSILWNTRTKKATVIDPGGDVDQILSAVERLGAAIDRIVLTHGHLDHIGGAAELAKKSGVQVEGPHLDDKSLIDGVADQARQFGLPDVAPVTPDRWLTEGDTVELGGVTFDVLHCPGHSPGHVVFVNKDLRFAISGDVLFAGSIGRTDLPGGDHATLIKSIKEKLLPLGDDITFLPGHGGASTFGNERQSNPFLA
ncbi:MBL fold metallo-hydrolase [Pseudovibrio sp. SPO723]|uniref:MBL fold metallo-hydrolase n=1 Tax=Nesiotobacter zosterae TaxID=392721 RepID=UPI0029C20E0C|nr:MBL fold metallo-hydrolase [Pseudovibrio sp. SPO723]MDX5593939.1 MBL fold metallo-hydrolase [Pseudovibrio sp. SPO723]